MTVQQSSFGSTNEGVEVSLFTLTNKSGSFVTLTNYGAIVVSVEVPDRGGNLANVNLGFPTLAGYLERHPYLGSTVGRFCNRIAKGRFALDGSEYDLVINNGPNHLHGGTVGFDKVVWKAEPVEQPGRSAVRLSAEFADGHEGYPGKLSVTALYGWSDDNELSYTFRATTDQPTVINMTNHAYWNLAGAAAGDVLKHQLQLECSHYLEVDETLIPSGRLVDVAGTPLDFTEYHELGERIEVLSATKGYDHCFVINGPAGNLRKAAHVREPITGRTMEVSTTQPGVQLYTGNHLKGAHAQHSGFCLETQHYPDSPNRPEFPSTRLNPGEVFEETTIHRFSTDS
ncbi:MAG: galactose mutarotase [Planctomycetales bacterium]|nr:galactose mutarotase [Planctomycetales bacterium]